MRITDTMLVWRMGEKVERPKEAGTIQAEKLSNLTKDLTSTLTKNLTFIRIRVDKDKDIESKGGAGGSGKSNVGNTPKGTSADKPRKVAAKRAAFVAPSLQEVKNYISEKGYTVDAQRFIDFYEAKGWMIGKNKMKDWRAAVRTWMLRPDEPQKQTTYEMRKTNFL